jgi:hypothetical protein
MCPFCFATMGFIVAGAVSTGGLAAFAVKLSKAKNARGAISNTKEGIKENANTHSR